MLGCVASPSSPDSDAVTLNGNRPSFFGLSSVMTMDSIFDQQVGNVNATWCSLCSSVDHVQTCGQRKWTMVECRFLGVSLRRRLSVHYRRERVRRGWSMYPLWTFLETAVTLYFGSVPS